MPDLIAPPVAVRRRRVAALLAGVGLLAALAAAPFAPAPPASALNTDASTNPWLQRRVLAIAHAGGEDEAPHSTLFAYKTARAEGVSMIDLDMQMTSDGVPIVLHNDTVDRTTNGTGNVATLTFAQVNALDAAYWYSDACWACHDRPVNEYRYRGMRTGAVTPPPGFTADDFGVPSVRQVFEQFPGVPVDIEIKGTAPATYPAAEALAALITEFHRSDITMVASFDSGTLEHFSQAAPDVPTSATQDEVMQFFVNRQPIPGRQVLDVPPFYNLGGTRIEVVTRQFVEDAHAAGLGVWVWMDSGDEENADFYGHLLDLGVDGINAARPNVLLGVLRQRGLLWGEAPPPTVPPATTPTTLGSGPRTAPSPSAPPAVATPAAPTYTG